MPVATAAASAAAVDGGGQELAGDIADEDRVERLAALGCTPEEIAGILGMEVERFRREHAKTYERGRAAGRAGLRRLLWKAAGEGKATILIWLSRHWFEGAGAARHDDAGDEVGDELEELESASEEGTPLEGARTQRRRRPLDARDLLERPIIIERHVVPGASAHAPAPAKTTGAHETPPLELKHD